MAKFKTVIFTATMAIAMLLCSCSHQPASAPQSAYPVAIDPSKVGDYPALTKAGGGYVYDEVLEYRVWINADGDDYYYAFATYEDAKDFSEKTERAEEPLVLLLQHEHINEPEPGKYEHVTGDRITEWRVEWLEGNKRSPDTIANFLREKATESAQQVPGTSVSITPPNAYIAADRFPGFMNEATGSSIMVSEIPGPYGEVTAGFNDEKRMQAQGMTLLSKSSVKVDGHTGMLLHIEQPANGTLFKKWMVAVDRSGATTLIVASYPEAAAKQGELLKTAILAATFGKATDPTDALTFSVTPSPPFKVAKVFGQNMILSPDGRFPVKDENVPLMILGLSASEDLAIPDKKTFSERRVTKTAIVKNISVNQSTPVKIGDLSGYATTAKGEGEDAATPLTVYQVLLFDTSGYCVIQGRTPSAEKNTYMPVFEKIAKSFKMKESRNK
jgi:hypothetical protein